MYQVYVGGKEFYNPSKGEGYVLAAALLKTAINKAGTFDFTLPFNNVAYEDIVPFLSRIAIMWANTPVWEGFPIAIKRDYWNNKVVTCNGQLAVLNDGVLPGWQIGNTDQTSTFSSPYAKLIDNILQVYNSQVDSWKAVMLKDCDFQYMKDRNGTDFTSISNFSAVTDNKWPSVMEWLTMTDFEARAPLVPPYNGYIIPEYAGPRSEWDSKELQISIKSTSGALSDQKIEFGKNLIDLENYIDVQEVYTAVYPTGQREVEGGGTEIFSLLEDNSAEYGNFIYASTSVLNSFGRRVKYIHYDNITTVSELRKAATADLAQLISAATSFRISAVDLSLLDVDISAIRAGDYYQVISAPHELNATFQCTEADIDLTDPTKGNYTFGTTPETLTQWIQRQR